MQSAGMCILCHEGLLDRAWQELTGAVAAGIAAFTRLQVLQLDNNQLTSVRGLHLLPNLRCVPVKVTHHHCRERV